ncbi:MAG: CxxxxCH/CxxCH domain c-type cytochrome [Desulfuromonadaceae bacterium]
MPSMKFWTKMLCVTVVCCALFACGKNNDAVTSLNSANKHPDTWITDHRAAYRANRDSCRECHGSNLNVPVSTGGSKGGTTKIDCFNQAELGQCHVDGHGPREIPKEQHVLPFKDGSLHGPEAKKDLSYCQSCHSTKKDSKGNPLFNEPIGYLKKGCEDCHAANTAHPVWKVSSGLKGHASAGNMGNSCYLCHASTGEYPACGSCHKLALGSIPTLGTCVSCHAKPPVTGNHSTHNAITGVTNVCSTCHTGAGSGSINHGTKNVAFDSSYNAKTGAAVKNSDGSCSNISCHGGVKTPAWVGGVRSNGCAFCHTSGTAQYNSYYSGQHDEHVNGQNLACTDCHDMTKTTAPNHFSGLGTTGFELAPALTIRVPGYSAASPSCTPGVTPPAGTYSVGVCHANRSW